MIAPVDVIIVNFNAGDALIRCIQSVLSQDVPVRVTVIDNASGDRSALRARELFADSEAVCVIRNENNPGFACAVNQAARLAAERPAAGAEADAQADYLLILNPDCVLEPQALDRMVRALDGEPAAALAGPAVTGADGELLRGTLRRFPDPWRSFLTVSGLARLGGSLPALRGVEVDAADVSRTGRAEAVSGACMLVRKAAFTAAGGMDEAYGLHCEDLDLMYRLGERGGYCLYVPEARVYHEQGLSSASRPAWVHWQKHLGMQRFFRKFQAPRYGLPVRWLVTAGIWLRFAATLPLALLRR